RAKRVSISSSGTGEAVRRLVLTSALTDVASTPATNNASGTWRIVRLEGTRREAEQIAQLGRSSGRQADIWLDLEASETNIRQREIKQYRVLHFATHGLLNAERPQFTGLVLSLVGESEGDGF